MPLVTERETGLVGNHVLADGDTDSLETVGRPFTGEVRVGVPEVDQHEVGVSPSVATVRPRRCSVAASCLALATICAADPVDSGWCAAQNPTALPATSCISGPPWHPGRTAP